MSDSLSNGCIMTGYFWASWARAQASVLAKQVGTHEGALTILLLITGGCFLSNSFMWLGYGVIRL